MLHKFLNSVSLRTKCSRLNILSIIFFRLNILFLTWSVKKSFKLSSLSFFEHISNIKLTMSSSSASMPIPCLCFDTTEILYFFKIDFTSFKSFLTVETLIYIESANSSSFTVLSCLFVKFIKLFII